MANISRIAARVAFLFALVLILGRHANAADAPSTKIVKAGDLTLKVPEAWRAGALSGNARFSPRKAQLKVPRVGSDKEDADFVVYYFAGGAGPVDANIQRWVNAFQSSDRKVKVTTGKSTEGDYVLVDTQGTWNKPVGEMGPGQKHELTLNSRALGVILTTNVGYYIRLTGPEKTVTANADAFRAAFGADAKSEKERPAGQE
jgi:gluconolactonase